MNELGTKELIAEIKALSLQDVGWGLIPFVSELAERKDEISEREIISEIKNISNSLFIQEIMVDLYIWKNPDSVIRGDLKQLLNDTAVSNEVKSRIVSQSSFNSDDIELLNSLIENNDDILAFNALKKLSSVNEKEAYLLSKKILENYESESNMRISAAQKSAAKYLRKNADPEARKEFIKQCKQILESPKTDEMLKESSRFALSDMRTKESITEIINSDFFDQSVKVFCIDQNNKILKEMLTSSSDESDIEIVIKAMEIFPLADLGEELEELQTGIKNPELKARCEKVVESIKLNGIKACPKWEED